MVMLKFSQNLFIGGLFDSKWLKSVKETLDNCGMSHVWLRPCSANPEWFKMAVKRKLTDIYIQKWTAEKHSNILCTNYRIFKTNFNFEIYLVKLRDCDRINVCKFRAGNHKLPISDKRYDPNSGNNSCNLCAKGEKGDEFHYILVCPYFSQERKELIKKYFWKSPNCIKFLELFCTENFKELQNLSKLIKLILSHFS